MPEKMNISVNGQSQVPPGFRFHPTEEELLHYYLKKKVSCEKIDLDVIRDVDLNKLEPWDIQETCKIGTTPQNNWYFFSHKDKKYPTGTRTNRATAAGFWKATGRDKVIYGTGLRIGMRKTLVFYKGRAPHGLKSDWIMHEYRLDDTILDANVSNVVGKAAQEEGWVVCRIFKKKNYHKTLDGPFSSSYMNEEARTQLFDACNEGALDQILEYMSSACKNEDEANTRSRLLKPIDTSINNGMSYYDKFMKLPSLESPNLSSSQSGTVYTSMINDNEGSVSTQVSCMDHGHNPLDTSVTSWSALDRLVASQLNGQSETSKQFGCLVDPTMAYCNPINQPYHDIQLPTLKQSLSLPFNRPPYHETRQDYDSEIEPWNLTNRSSSSSDLFCHVSSSSA